MLDILANSSLLNSKPISLPMEQHLPLSKCSGAPLSDASLFRRFIGRLLYLTITRPNISYAV